MQDYCSLKNQFFEKQVFNLKSNCQLYGILINKTQLYSLKNKIVQIQTIRKCGVCGQVGRGGGDNPRSVSGLDKKRASDYKTNFL